jgi:hypothetical protein
VVASRCSGARNRSPSSEEINAPSCTVELTRFGGHPELGR